ncbi:MAG: hypothetical protein KBS59_07600, partial [Clostridiales bacterium]|nr:hypothetical protein [Clostridiales bacterium]
QTMNKFLWEGIDCDEYGEYTERSAGMYNVVCDRSFIQLAHTMNDKKFLEYPIRNMRLMRSFFEPDGTICTLNSVRQDRGTKVYWDTYNVVFMVLAYETGDPEFAYYANKWLNERMCDAQRSEKPYGYTDPYLMYWFLINEDWQNKADKIEAKLPDRDIDVYLPESGMARIYKKGSALTVCRTNTPGFLKFQIGSKYLLARFAGSFFGNPHSQFRPKIMEKTETGFRLVSNEEAGYRSQFDEAPETSVWRHMDHSKRHIINVQNFDTVIDVTPKDDGFALDISFDGASRIPVKLELLIAPDCKVMTDSVNFMARSGDYVYFKNGKMTVRYQDGVAFELTGGSYKLFGSENMRGADPRPHDNFTVCINSQTPGTMHLELKRI